MDDKDTSKKPSSIAEIDFPLLCKHFGKQKAIQIMLLAKAKNEEAMIRIGAKEREERKGF